MVLPVEFVAARWNFFAGSVTPWNCADQASSFDGRASSAEPNKRAIIEFGLPPRMATMTDARPSKTIAIMRTTPTKRKKSLRTYCATSIIFFSLASNPLDLGGCGAHVQTGAQNTPKSKRMRATNGASRTGASNALAQIGNAAKLKDSALKKRPEPPSMIIAPARSWSR